MARRARRFPGEAVFAYVMGEGRLLPSGRRPRRRYTGAKPVRAGTPTEARLASVCFVCGAKVRRGDLICKARFPNSAQRWVHTACCRDEPADREAASARRRVRGGS